MSILSAHSDDAYIEHAMAMGAAGYMIKQTAQHGLAGAIREVCKGRPFFSLQPEHFHTLSHFGTVP